MEAAKKEGKFIWYSAFPTGPSELVAKGFEAKTPGIKAEVFYQVGAALQETFFADKARGKIQADVFCTGAPEMADMGAKGAFAKYKNLDFEANAMPDLKTQGQPYAYFANLGFAAIAFNKDKVSEAEIATIKTWQDLTDPRWKGRGLTVDPNSATSFLSFHHGWRDLMGDQGYEDWLKALKANDYILFNSNVPAIDAVVRGERHLAIIASHTAAREIANGAPIDLLFIQPAPARYVSCAMVDGGPNPKAAQVFMDYLFSQEGQDILAHSQNASAARVDVVDRRPVTKSKHFVTLDKMRVITFNDWYAVEQTSPQLVQIHNRAMGIR
jgi:iron(III) transport system substrate-binding protein